MIIDAIAPLARVVAEILCQSDAPTTRERAIHEAAIRPRQTPIIRKWRAMTTVNDQGEQGALSQKMNALQVSSFSCSSLTRFLKVALAVALMRL
jgi:hypothetical protein